MLNASDNWHTGTHICGGVFLLAQNCYAICSAGAGSSPGPRSWSKSAFNVFSLFSEYCGDGTMRSACAAPCTELEAQGIEPDKASGIFLIVYGIFFKRHMRH